MSKPDASLEPKARSDLTPPHISSCLPSMTVDSNLGIYTMCSLVWKPARYKKKGTQINLTQFVTMKFAISLAILTVAAALASASPFPDRAKYSKALNVKKRMHKPSSISVLSFMRICELTVHSSWPLQGLGAEVSTLRGVHEKALILPSCEGLHGQ